MAGFSDTIKLTIDVVSGQTASFKGFLASAKSDITDAEGAFGKLKAAGGNAFDFLQQNAGAFALGAGTALVGFGAKAVSTFQDAALGAGKLRDTLGLTADQASRWEEVSNDLGIGTDKLTTTFGFMEKTLGKTPGLFQQLGVEIAHAKDGTVDANGTFLNVIQTLHNIEDPAQRAAAAQKLLGKSWQDSSELIELGAAGVKARLDDVQSSKIFSDDQIDQSRKFRDAMDNIHDAVEGLFIQVGSDLVPSLTNLSNVLSTVLGPLDKFNDGLHKLDNIPGLNFVLGALNPLKSGINAAADAMKQLSGATDGVGNRGTAQFDATTQALLAQTSATDRAANAARQSQTAFTVTAQGLKGFTSQTGEFVAVNNDASDSIDENNRKLYDSQAATTAAAAAQKDASDQINRVNDALHKQADALSAQADAAHNSADSQVAANDAQVKFNQALTDQQSAVDAAADAVKKHGLASSEAADAATSLGNAERDTRDAAIALANATVQHASDQAKANGQVFTAVDALDQQTASLVATASQAKGPARDAIIQYIAALHGIDPQRVTDIIANTPNLADVNGQINNTSRTRQVELQAQATNTAATSNALDAIAHARTVPYIPTVGGNATARAGGGTVKPGEITKVGEQGPELAVFPPGTNIIPANQTADILNGASGGSPVVAAAGGGGNVYIDKVIMPPGTDAGQTVRQLRRYVRYNGPAAVTF